MLNMTALASLILSCFLLQVVNSFVVLTPNKNSQFLFSETQLHGTNRKARRLQKKQQRQNKGRPTQFYEPQGDDAGLSNMPLAKETTNAAANADDDDDPTKAHSKMPTVTNEDPVHSASVATVSKAEKERPEVSTVVIDENTGIERIVQGKAVMDVITRKAVKLYDEPMLRLAQLSPGVPPEIRDEYRFNNFYTDLEVPDIIARFKKAAIDPDTNALPEHPSVLNTALDFVLANRDYLGQNFKKLLGRLKLRHQSLQEVEEARSYRALWKHFVTIEDHLSAPFRQMILNSEAVIGPNFGNLDVTSYLKGDLATRAAHYITLKATVAHWEKKLKDAEQIESSSATSDPAKQQQSMAQQQLQQLLSQQGGSFILSLSIGDPKRFLPDPPIIFRLNEVVRVCSMAQQISSEFVKNSDLFDDLPPELRFLEKALYTKGGTELRRYMIEEFCPQENITPDALREGLRRLDVQLSNLQIDPYGDFKNVVGKLCEALAVGTDEERDLYAPYLYNLDVNGPGYFQTYTFNHDKNSLVRFLDNAKQIEKGTMGPVDDVMSQISGEFTSMLGIQSKQDEESRRDPMRPEYVPADDYRPPERRASGRPHNLGWLDLLEEDTAQEGIADKLEADLWKEITN